MDAQAIMGKVRSLTVHKNTRDRRRAREIKHGAVSFVRDVHSMWGRKLAGYALVLFDENMNASVAYDTGKHIPLYDLGRYVGKAVDVAAKGEMDDFET